MLCPCKVRNKFIVNFETALLFCVYPVQLREGYIAIKYVHKQLRFLRPYVLVLMQIYTTAAQSPLVTVQVFMQWRRLESTKRKNCVNPLNTKRRLLYLKTQFIPRSEHFSSRL